MERSWSALPLQPYPSHQQRCPARLMTRSSWVTNFGQRRTLKTPKRVAAEGKMVLLGYHEITKQRSDGKLTSIFFFWRVKSWAVWKHVSTVFFLLRGVSPPNRKMSFCAKKQWNENIFTPLHTILMISYPFAIPILDFCLGEGCWRCKKCKKWMHLRSFQRSSMRTGPKAACWAVWMGVRKPWSTWDSMGDV